MARMGDTLVDRLFRRPSGRTARFFYRDAKPHHESFRVTLDALALGPGDQLLELGCGGRTFLNWALSTSCTARAIDHSVEMLALATHRNAAAIADGRLTLHQADAEELPFPDGTFTATASANAFFFFDRPDRVLAEMHRTLVPGGRTAICTTDTAPSTIAKRMHLHTGEQLLRLHELAGFERILVERASRGGRLQLVTAHKAI
jgi:ubiquinone/menaquinone biosynthesis C-methylase UbiE